MRTRFTPVRAVMFFSTATVLSGAFAVAATTLKPNVTSGIRYAFDNSMKLDLNLTLNAMGQQVNVQQALLQKSSGSLEVLEAANGKLSKARITFAPTCGASVTMMGQQQNTPFALAGKTVTATVGPLGVDIQPPEGVDDATRKTVAELLEGEDGIYPKAPVNVGDEWTGALGSGQMKSDLKLKLDRVSKINGREVAELSASGTLSGVENGMNMNGTIAGPVMIDVQTGLISGATIDGDLKIDGNLTEGGQQIAVNGTGKMGIATKNQIEGSAADSGKPAVTPVVPGAADAPAAPAAVLAGTYEGDGLTMKVNGDELQLQLGANQFSGKITQRNGPNLSGTFTHQGASFDFKCVVNGEQVDFTTGTKTYKLKKQGGSNPLG